MNPTPEQIRQWIGEKIVCEHLEVRGDGRHFEAMVVSAEFDGLSRVRRQQKVYSALGARMASEIHALSMRALTPDEWHGQN